METRFANFKRAVATLAVALMPVLGAAQERSVEEMLEALRQAGPDEVSRIERDILFEWSKSGSPAMDLLLERGRNALEISDFGLAVEHFTALTDHAPGFAEGWHGLALAYFRLEAIGPAIDALERVLALNPQHFQALKGMAAILEALDRPELAVQAYTAVLEIRPHDDEVAEALTRLTPLLRGTTL